MLQELDQLPGICTWYAFFRLPGVQLTIDPVSGAKCLGKIDESGIPTQTAQNLGDQNH